MAGISIGARGETWPRLPLTFRNSSPCVEMAGIMSKYNLLLAGKNLGVGDGSLVWESVSLTRRERRVVAFSFSPFPQLPNDFA